MEQGLAALRSISLRPEPALVASTQRRVREHALRLREVQGRRRGLVLSSILAAVLTGLTGLSLWRVLDWLGGVAVTPWVWAAVLLSFWFVPGILAGAAAWAAGPATERRSALTS